MTRPNNAQAHTGSCPRAQFWDAGEFQAPCTCLEPLTLRDVADFPNGTPMDSDTALCVRAAASERDSLLAQLSALEARAIKAESERDALARELERLADAADCMAERGSNPQRTNESIPWALYAQSIRALLSAPASEQGGSK